MSVIEDVLTLLDEDEVIERGVNGFTEADLGTWTERPVSVVITNRTTPSEPSLTADVDSHGLTVAVITGRGETGYSAGSEMAEAVYRAVRLRLDMTINGTFYPCIRAITPPYLVQVVPDGTSSVTVRSEWHVDLDILRYIGE